MMKSGKYALVTVVLVSLSLASQAMAGTHGDDEKKDTPKPDSRTVQVAAGASNRLAWSLFKELRTEKENKGKNFIFSPLSAFFAIALLYNATDGDTRKQILATMATYRLSEKELNAAVKGLLAALEKGDGFEVAAANVVMVHPELKLTGDFAERVGDSFNALTKKLTGKDAEDLKAINDWAKGKVPMLPKILDSLPPNTKAVLLNATTFKGTWQTAFKKAHDGEFNGKAAKMMTTPEGSFKYAKDADGYEMVRLPYGKEGKAYMTVVLPPKGQTPDITPERHAALAAKLAEKEGTVTMPKFGFESELPLNASLKKLGITDAFTEGTANFGRLTDTKGLYVSEAKQKAFVRVDELGTEAGAVTAIGIMSRGIGPASIIKVDRPFHFAISDDRTKAISFMGVVEDPTK